MILDTINNAHRYAMLHPLFTKVFDYIQSTNLHALAPGKHSIAGDDLFVIIERVQGRSRDSTQLECHRKYIDIRLYTKHKPTCISARQTLYRRR